MLPKTPIRSHPNLRARLLVLAIALSLGLAAEPRGAFAFDPAGSPWPAGRISFHNHAKVYGWSVRKAVASWNRSGAGISFVRAPANRAQLQIRLYPPGESRRPRCRRPAHGEGTLGYVGSGYDEVVLLARPRSRRCAERHLTASVVAHELGHVIGLDHETGNCAVMNPIVYSRCEGPIPKGWWRCRLIDLDDVAGAVELYGGEAAKLRRKRLCRAN